MPVADWVCLLTTNQRPVDTHLSEGITAPSLSMAKDNKVSSRPGFRFSAGRITGKQDFHLCRKISSNPYPRESGRTDPEGLATYFTIPTETGHLHGEIRFKRCLFCSTCGEAILPLTGFSRQQWKVQ